MIKVRTDLFLNLIKKQIPDKSFQKNTRVSSMIILYKNTPNWLQITSNRTVGKDAILWGKKILYTP